MTDQNSQFFAILTAIGKAKQANADALGIPWTFAQMGVGDANGTDPIPDEQQTQLINEQRRAPLNELKVDPANPNVIIAEQVIPENVGGWWLREIGLYDADDDLVAVANCPPSYKPLVTQGSGRTQVVRVNLIVANTANVVLRIDPSIVLATRAYVDSRTVRANQEEAEAGIENSKLMTPARVFQAIAKVVRQATESTFGWAKISSQEQVADGTDDTTIVTPQKLREAQASQFEAETGTDDTKLMTPLRVVQTIRSIAATASESLQGVLRIGTQEEVIAGTLDNVTVTPAKMRIGLTYSLTANGYIIFPSWLLGITFMWGATQTDGSGYGTTTFPLAFPNVCWHVFGTARATNPALIGILGGSGAPSQTGYSWYASTINGSGGVLGIDWIAIGR